MGEERNKDTRRMEKGFLIDYLKKLAQKCAEIKLNPEELLSELQNQHDIKPDNKSLWQILSTSADVGALSAKPVDVISTALSFPKAYKGPVECIIVDDNVKELKQYIKNIPKYIDKLAPKCHRHLIKYDSRKDMSYNLSRVQDSVETMSRTYPNALIVILLDLNLTGSDASGLELGEAFFLEVRRKWPYLPTFALTRYRDIETVMRISQLGANGYLYKPSLALLPFAIGLFLQRTFGPIIEALEPEDQLVLCRHVLSWKNMPDVLWFGDKVPIMVDHGRRHTENLWALVNNLYQSLGKTKEDRDTAFTRLLAVETLNNKDRSQRLLAFMLSIWLHDIGHKGNDFYQSPAEIRRLHGAISAFLVMDRPDLYLPHLNPGSTGWLEVVERVAILCRSHVSNAPLDESTFRELQKEQKLTAPYELGNMPIISNPERKEILFSLPLPLYEESASGRKYVIVPPDMRPSVALLRFVDAVDLRKNRVGDIFYLSVKQDAIFREISYIYEAVQRAGGELEMEFLRLHPTYRKELDGIHESISAINAAVRDIVEKQKGLLSLYAKWKEDFTKLVSHPVIYHGMIQWLDEHKTVTESLLDKCMGFLPKKNGNTLHGMEVLRNLVDYLILLAIQQKYFIIHQAFREVQFNHKVASEGTVLSVTYILDQMLPERTSDEVTRILYVIGVADLCVHALDYVKKEWLSSGGYLKQKKLVVSDVTFIVGPTTGKEVTLPIEDKASSKQADGTGAMYEKLFGVAELQGSNPLGDIRILFDNAEVREGGRIIDPVIFDGQGVGTDVIIALKESMKKAFLSLVEGRVQKRDSQKPIGIATMKKSGGASIKR